MKRHDSEDQPGTKKMILEAIGEEIIRLARLHDAAAKIEELKRERNIAGTSGPSLEASERLIRYGAHMSRENDRILNRLEQLQRIRKDQPLPPRLEVKIS